MTEAKRTVEEVMGLVRAMQGEFSQSCDPEREALESAITTIIAERDSLAKEVDFLKADIESTEKECDALKARADKLAKHCVVVITERGATSPVVWCTFCQAKSHSLTSALKHAEDCIVEPQTKVATEER